ncbi:MAG: hypothetical protein ACR2O4_02935, partial [Hyphomicrobiaceae bacterium]
NDLTTMLARTDRELIVALEGTARYSDTADARAQWTAEKQELERLVGFFAAATETKTFTVVVVPGGAALAVGRGNG